MGSRSRRHSGKDEKKRSRSKSRRNRSRSAKGSCSKDRKDEARTQSKYKDGDKVHDGKYRQEDTQGEHKQIVIEDVAGDGEDVSKCDEGDRNDVAETKQENCDGEKEAELGSADG